MAYVIVSAGHLTDSRPRTLRARPVLVVAATATLLLMAACVALGFQLAQPAAPLHATSAAHIDRPELLALVGRVGRLAGRLTQLEQQAATLAQRLRRRTGSGDPGTGPGRPLQWRAGGPARRHRRARDRGGATRRDARTAVRPGDGARPRRHGLRNWSRWC